MGRWWMPFSRTGSVAQAPPARSTQDSPAGSLQTWQKLAWGYSKTLGEVHYARSFYARMLSGVTLYCQERTMNDDGEEEWVETTQADVVDSLRRLENTRGGMSALQAKFAELRFVQGEAMLTCTYCDDGPGGGAPVVLSEEWEMLSAAELSYSKAEKQYTRKRKLNGQVDKIPETDPANPLPDTMIAYRIYHQDAEYSGMADSSMRAVLEDCEELLLLKRAIRNTARNRGAGNGILILPASMGGQEVDMGDGTKIPKNAKAIYDALTAPIADENASHAVTPVILFAPNNVTSQQAFHIDLRGAALYKETGLRDECIRRIAIGLDMPPEKLTGTAVSNHWTAWQIDDAAWTEHGDPVTRELCEDLTSILLGPVLMEKKLDPTTFRVWFDATAVIEDPDRARAAMVAHDRLIISDAAYRRETGWEESDAPDDAEWEKRAAIAKPARGTAPAETGVPSAEQAVSPDRIWGMAEACVQRCRELAGSRLRTKMQSNGTPPNLQARIKSAHNCEVAAKLGHDVETSVDPDVLVAGAGQAFLLSLFKLGLERSLSETLVRRVEEHAARTLFDDEPAGLPEEVIQLCVLTSRRM